MVADNEDVHFVHDEDLLERYVLGRLTGADRRRCERHLRRCEICQRTVLDEQRIAAGAKQLGREQMKERLRRHVDSSLPAEVPWQRIAGIAAVVLIIIGIGVIYRWWETTRLKQEPTITELKPEERAAAPTDQKQSTGAKPNPVVPVPKEESGRVTQSVERDKLGFQNRQERVSARANPVAEGSADESKLEAAADHAGRRDARANAQARGGPTTQEFWLVGVVLSGPSGSAPASPANEPLRQEKGTYGKDRTVAAGKKSAVQVNAVRGTEFAVSQQPVGALPPSRQQQIVPVPRIVETLVRQEGGQTSLTLFLDSLVDDRSLETARIEYVTSDSVILHLSDQRIGYKMPAAWSQAKNTQIQISK